MLGAWINSDPGVNRYERFTRSTLLSRRIYPESGSEHVLHRLGQIFPGGGNLAPFINRGMKRGQCNLMKTRIVLRQGALSLQHETVSSSLLSHRLWKEGRSINGLAPFNESHRYPSHRNPSSLSVVSNIFNNHFYIRFLHKFSPRIILHL